MRVELKRLQRRTGITFVYVAKVVASGTIEAAGGLKLQVPLPDGVNTGDSVEVSIRPENIHLKAGGSDARSTISERTFLGNICEYYVSLDSGPALRVQTHPAQVFAVGDKVAVEIDASQCSVFRS
jgi:ABC-type Fe3+/spermidine/putrescine transport system ATPase subunit